MYSEAFDEQLDMHSSDIISLATIMTDFQLSLQEFA